MSFGVPFYIVSSTFFKNGESVFLAKSITYFVVLHNQKVNIFDRNDIGFPFIYKLLPPETILDGPCADLVPI